MGVVLYVWGQREVDLRVSTVPTSFGERAVLRVLDKSAGVFQLEELGLAKEDLADLDSLLDRSHGVIFVTGPTGSGKSTSLYAYLNRLNSSEKNVITIEDPIEYQLEGNSQIQVASKKGMTFATSLRHVLRQDPDVIMIGEVRDVETARMAIQILTDRSLGLQYATYQRLGRCHQPSIGPGCGALFGQFFADRGSGTASGTSHLPPLQRRGRSFGHGTAWIGTRSGHGP